MGNGRYNPLPISHNICIIKQEGKQDNKQDNKQDEEAIP